MKILHLRATNFYGGPERQIHFHARRARGSEFTIVVASFSEAEGRPRLLEAAAEDGIATHLFEARSSYDFGVVGRIRRELTARAVDVLCTHDYRSALVGGLATAGTPTRWIAFSRGFTSDDFKVRAFHALDKLMVRFADHVVAVSASQKRKLVRLLVPASRISVVPNAVEMDFFDGHAATDLRARFDWPADAIVVVAGGRFSREKGQVHLVRAARKALESEPRLRFALFGEGPDLDAVRAETQALRLTGRVVLPGFERALLGCVRGADVLVNPSLSEGLPNIVLEAMALGTCALVTDVGGHPEVVEHERSGLLVPAADDDALAAALVRLARDAGLRSALADRARAFVRDECGFDRQFERLATVYRSFDAKKGRATGATLPPSV